jgi:2-methylcitrate dehydratase PrpD
MALDDEINAAYPRQWIGRVTVRTTDGRTLEARVDVPKGDPDNTLSRPELEAKAIQLAPSATAPARPRCVRSSAAYGARTGTPRRRLAGRRR